MVFCITKCINEKLFLTHEYAACTKMQEYNAALGTRVPTEPQIWNPALYRNIKSTILWINGKNSIEKTKRAHFGVQKFGREGANEIDVINAAKIEKGKGRAGVKGVEVLKWHAEKYLKIERDKWPTELVRPKSEEKARCDEKCVQDCVEKNSGKKMSNAFGQCLEKYTNVALSFF